MSTKGDNMTNYSCSKCGHSWMPRKLKPLKCPKCQSFKWAEKKKKDK